eukprot:NODE_307_length_11332_cov_0.276774.p3 type:complete len:390 gc:universal NODE_307_length_11332_cov_0.276774:3968-2799(-)
MLEFKISEQASRTHNPIRAIVDNIQEWNKDLEKIALSLGDPTVFGNFPVPKTVTDSICSALASGKANGYPPSVGYESARLAVADFWSSANNSKVSKDQVILTSGCSHALEMSLKVLCNPGDAVLIARPSFSLYSTLANNLDIKIIYYDLLPTKGWEVDVEQLDQLLHSHSKIKSIVINNPSNPCGSNYCKQHLLDIVKILEKHSIPIIADEIYANMVFDDQFYALGELTTLPVLSTGGIAKQFLCPGYRLGWVIVYRNDAILDGVVKLSQLILGPNSLIQYALKDIFKNTRTEYYKELNDKLKEHAYYIYDKLSPHTTVIKPQGAMYVMFKVPGGDDVAFCKELMKKYSVQCLPGQCFGIKGYVRVVITPTKSLLDTALERMIKHIKEQ